MPVYRLSQCPQSQENIPSPRILSARLFEEIALYDQAFFDYFCPVEIPNLGDGEISLMLEKRAEADGNKVLLRHLEEIKDKVKAITHMTGGNPRLVQMLYDVLCQHELMPVVQTLREVVGGLTPMLKHILDDMPRQQSKTLDGLVRLGGAASPADISRVTRLPLNFVTTQLARLKEARFVSSEGGGKGKPATYHVWDAMFRTWYQMRYLRPARRRIELFVDFLRAWFTIEERQRFLEEQWQFLSSRGGGVRVAHSEEPSVAIEYYAASLEIEQERRGHLERVADLHASGGRQREAAMLLADLDGNGGTTVASYEAGGYRLLGDRLLDRKQVEEALRTYLKALKRDPEDVHALMGAGLCHGQLGNRVNAGKQFDRILCLGTVDASARAGALNNRGISKGQRGDIEGEIADYTAAIELEGAPADQVAWALNNRGMAYGRRDEPQQALRDFETALEVPGLSEEQRSYALLNRAIALGELDRESDSLLSLAQCAESRGSVKTVHRAVRLLVRAHLRKGQHEEATRWATRLAELESEDAGLDERIEVRLDVIVQAGRVSLDVAEQTLNGFLRKDLREVKDRIAFVIPGIALAKTGDEKALGNSPMEERDAARRIAAALKGDAENGDEPLQTPVP